MRQTSCSFSWRTDLDPRSSECYFKLDHARLVLAATLSHRRDSQMSRACRIQPPSCGHVATLPQLTGSPHRAVQTLLHQSRISFLLTGDCGESVIGGETGNAVLHRSSSRNDPHSQVPLLTQPSIGAGKVICTPPPPTPVVVLLI